MTSREMDELVARVMGDHEMREDRCESLPLQRRGFSRRPRPQTAIISRRAAELTIRRQGKAI